MLKFDKHCSSKKHIRRPEPKELDIGELRKLYFQRNTYFGHNSATFTEEDILYFQSAGHINNLDYLTTVSKLSNMNALEMIANGEPVSPVGASRDEAATDSDHRVEYTVAQLAGFIQPGSSSSSSYENSNSQQLPPPPSFARSTTPCQDERQQNCCCDELRNVREDMQANQKKMETRTNQLETLLTESLSKALTYQQGLCQTVLNGQQETLKTTLEVKKSFKRSAEAMLQ